MLMKKIVITMCGMLLANAAQAGLAEIKSSNSQLALQASTLNVDYAEYDDAGVLLDTEKGPVSGRALVLSHMWGVANWYAQLQYSRNEGRTDYVGGLIGPPPTPYGSVVTTSGAIFTNYSARLGKGFEPGISGSNLLTPFVEWGRQEWYRGVNAGETYYHNTVAAGLQWQISPANSKLVYILYGLYGKTYAASIDVVGYFNGGLGGSPLTKAGLGVDYALTKNLHLNAGVDYVRFDYGKSDVYGGYLEPFSKTTYLIYKAGLGISF